MLRLAYALAALLLLVLALFPFPPSSALHAEPNGNNRFYLSSVLQQSAGNATATPIPVPTPTPSGVVAVLDNHSWYFNKLLSYYFVVGEVENGTDNPIELIQVLITFYDESDNPIYSDSTFVKGEQLSSGEKSCFLLIADGLDTAWARYEFSDITYFDYPDNSPSLSVSNVTGDVVEYETYEEYEVQGIVRNSSSSAVPFAEMVGTLYNTQGTVVDCGFAWEYDMPPNSNESFAIEYNFRLAYSGLVDSLRILPTGNFGDSPARSPKAQKAQEQYQAEQINQRELGEIRP